MRRMYSKKELQDIIKANLENGSLDINAIKITGDEIVENMSGYSFSITEDEGWTKSVIYAAAVKNGNKLTLVCSGKITRTSDSASQYPTLGVFTIPQNIADKIFPIKDYNVDFRTLEFWASLGDLATTRGYTTKNNNQLLMKCYANISANKEFSYRYELTFLLSENLASTQSSKSSKKTSK